MIKSSFYIVLSTLIKLFLGFLSVKLLAQYIGANGFGKLGQFMSLISILGLISAGGISNGIISNVSRFKNNPDRVNKIISAGVWIGLISGLLIGVVLFLLSKQISYFLFQSTEYQTIIEILSVLQIFTIFSVVFGGYLNGLQLNKDFSILTILSYSVATFLLFALVKFKLFEGALLSQIFLLIIPGIFFIVFYKFKFSKKIIIYSFNNIDKGYYYKLLKHSAMLILSAILVPIVQIYTRNLIAENTNWFDVGLWQSASKISETGLVFLNVIMVNYYLPEIGKNKSKNALNNLYKKAFKYLIPILVIFITSVYFTRNFLIELLFSSEFKHAEKYIFWQTLSDSIKVLSTIFGYIIIFKEKVLMYVFFEILIFLLMVILTNILIPEYGALGANFSSLITNSIVLIVGLFLYRYRFLYKQTV